MLVLPGLTDPGLVEVLVLPGLTDPGLVEVLVLPGLTDPGLVEVLVLPGLLDPGLVEVLLAGGLVLESDSGESDSAGQSLPNTSHLYLYNMIVTITIITTLINIANSILELSTLPPELFLFESIVIIRQEVKIIR